MSSRASSFFTLAGLGLAAFSLATGCEGGASTANTDAAGGGRPDASTGTLSDVLGGGNGGVKDTAAIEVKAPPPPPAIVGGAVKLLPKGAQFLGGITVACSYGQASTDAKARWCAFALPGATLSKAELWVMNMSKVTATSAPKCDTTSPDCIRLTTNLFTDTPQVGPSFPSAHRFYGDMLIYHADAKSASSQPYSGPIYAWQPGWPQPHKISGTDTAFRCVGHSRAPVAICLENLNATDAEPLTFDLFAGKIDTGTVTKIDKILPTHPTAMTSQWGAGFTADAKYFVYSTAHAAVPPATEQTPETLYYLATDMIGTAMPKQIGTPGISNWDISPDATRWFYMKDWNYSDTAPSGTLYTATFPDGTGEKKLAGTLLSGGNAGGIAGYDVVPSKDGKALAFVGLVQKFAAMTGEYRILKDPAGNIEDPANVVKLIDNSPTIPSVSTDLRYGWYFKNRNMTLQGITDSYVLRLDGSGECALSMNPTSSIFGSPFLENAGLAFWVDNYDQDTDSGDGMVASPADCTSKKKRFAQKIDWWFVKGDTQLLYTDDVADTTSTLRVAKIVNGELQAGEVIQKQIERAFRLLPNQEAVMYRIESSNASVDGLYYYPLGGTTASDAGAPDTAAPAADAAAGQ